jgi:sugar lactone lactonase YvrE/predicted nucleic acid-binding protein
LAIILVLLLLLLVGAGYYAFFNATKQLSFNIVAPPSDTIQPPQFLYSFAGTGTKLQRPVGVLVDGSTVYVADSIGRKIFVFDQGGTPKGSFGASQTVVPLYLAKNPKDGNIYVTDRRVRAVFKYTTSGKYLGEFKPNLPAEQLPKFRTGGVQWAPVAIGFAPDGTMYVTDILNGHRLLIFSPSGAFQRSVGNLGQVTDGKSNPGLFQFPNGVVVHNGLVYVTDSNNRRIQVFDKAGNFKQIIVTQGLPRGIDFLQPFPSDTKSTSDRMVIIDTLSHDGTIWNAKGDKILSFGDQGLLEGQFSYPDGVAVGERNKIFVADTSNGRIQVWGWPNLVTPVPLPQVGNNWWLCLLPLLLLPLLLLLRRKKFFATRDFILELRDFGELHVLTHRRRKWLVTEEDFEALKGITQGDVKLEDVLNATPHSESDVRDLVKRLEIDEKSAIVLSIAKRTPVFVTEDAEYRRLAKGLEVDVVNRTEFLQRFEKRTPDDQSKAEV